MMKEIKGADFSEDKFNRYSLWRVWDESKPLVMFIGLNPSKADSDEDDNTIKRVRLIAKNLGFGGFYMCNCFSFISTDPKALQMETPKTMRRNGEIVRRVAESCDEIVFAWGNFKVVRDTGTDRLLSDAFPNAKALHVNKNGSPKHPLYCKATTQLVPYRLKK